MRSAMAVLVVVLLTGTVAIRAAEEPAAPAVRLTVDLSDGSRIVGSPAIATFAVHSELGRIDVPFTKVKSLTFRDDHEGISAALVNGDLLSGTHDLGKLRLKTVFGDVAVDAALIRRIACAQGRNGAFARDGLVLWNRLGSEEDVTHSAVGPAGKWNGGRFVEGKFGKALELNMQEQFGVTFPGELLTSAAGCIEFWARLSDFPATLSPHANPGLIDWAPPGKTEGYFLLGFNGNDGQGNGGLCVKSSLAFTGTGPFGAWTYARAIGGGEVADWHHYALTWDAAGLKGLGNESRTVAVFVDGKVQPYRGVFSAATGLFADAGPHVLGLLNHQGLESGRVAYDNLKIWNFAKTDFSDRTEE